MQDTPISRLGTFLQTRWNFVTFFTVFAGSLASGFFLVVLESDVGTSFATYMIGVIFLTTWITGLVMWEVFGRLFAYGRRDDAQDDKPPS